MSIAFTAKSDNISVMKRLYVSLLILASVAIALRLAFFIFGLQHMPLSTDEAWPALMGLHVLKGEFPVFYWGQNYMGSQQAFFDACAFPLFGVNTLAARLYPFLFSLSYVAAVYLLTRRIYDQNAALTALALLVIPVPYLTMAGTLSVPPEYLPLTAMGSFALFLLAGIVLKRERHGVDAVALPFPEFIVTGRARASGPAGTVLSFLLLGLLLGFMFWLHLVAVSFIIVALVFIFLRDKFCFLRPPFWLMMLAFFIGGLPFWWFNIKHNFITFTDMAGTTDLQNSFLLCKHLFKATFLFMTGQKVMLYGDSSHYLNLPVFPYFTLGAVICGLIASVILTRLRGMVRWLRWRPRDIDGTAFLLALAMLVFYTFCRSDRSSWDSARFILPVMSVLPVLLAGGLEEIRRWSRLFFVLFMVVIIGSQAWGNFILYRQWSDPQVVGKQLELPDMKPLHSFLHSHGITRAYAHYWISYRLTFEAREQIICAEPYNERFPGRPVQYLDDVHSATNIAFITQPTLNFIPNVEDHLQMLGGTYKKEKAGDFTVFYEITPPYGKNKLQEVKRSNWRLTSNRRPDILSLMMDGKQETHWDTGEPQKAGDSMTIDLGSVEKICKIRFDLTGVEFDAPSGYKLEISRDGNEWQKVYESGAVTEGFFWENDQPWTYVGNNFFTTAFAPVDCRFIRMTLTKSQRRFWWSIAEIRVFGPT
jgi:4-amino-4-deoxy-L-arabinose transferase-like glycosyltransferase